MAQRGCSRLNRDHLLYQAMPKAYKLPKYGEPFDPEVFKLGKPCKRNHIHVDGFTLRYVKGGKCPICERTDALERQRQLRQDPAFRCKQAAYARDKRLKESRRSRSKHGLPYTPLGDAKTRAMRAAIKGAGKHQSVAYLVYKQQRDHWRQHPGDRAEYVRRRAAHKARWRYMTDESFRLYHRSKSKRRKAQQRGSTALMLSRDHLWRRWADFNNACAYCGADGDLHVEHVIPISRGGEHHLGNVVPACQSCNFSKGKADALTWYRSRPFFDETQWQRIEDLLARSQPGFHQPCLF